MTVTKKKTNALSAFLNAVVCVYDAGGWTAFFFFFFFLPPWAPY